MRAAPLGDVFAMLSDQDPEPDASMAIAVVAARMETRGLIVELVLDDDHPARGRLDIFDCFARGAGST